MNSHDFNEAVDRWITALDHYRFDQLCTRPAAGSWCLGQVYLHLINDTQFYIEQIITCLSTNEHAAEQPSAFGRTLLANNDFPDQLLPGAPANDLLPLPSGKEELLNGLLQIKNEWNSLAVQMANSPFQGRTLHPGLHYFGARDWFQFAGMHFRHHLRQKKRIDEFLKKTGQAK